MPQKISPLRKNILYFLSLFNTITLPVLVILFILFIFIDVPLKHLASFIIVYIVTKSLSLLLDTHTPSRRTPTLPEQHISLPLIAINGITLVFLAILIERYALGAYALTIYASSIVLINVIFFEFSYHFISRFMQTKSGNWVSRTLLLLVGAGIGIAAVNMMRSTPPASLGTDSAPKKSQSEVTGIISTVDPSNIPELTSSQTENTPPSQSAIANNTPTPPGGSTGPQSQAEVSGTLTTESTPGVRVDSIESVDGKATATIKDGKIVVQVVKPDGTGENTGAVITDGWRIHSSIKKAGAGGGLQGVVISGPIALPIAGIHESYQSIILTADGASGIFFTTDGSTPSCDGKGSVDTITDKKTFTLKAISCFGGNKIRGTVVSYVYSLGN